MINAFCGQERHVYLRKFATLKSAPNWMPYYIRLYGLTRDELRYTLRVDPKEVHGEDFPGETFRVLKEKEVRLYGEYRTSRLVLDAWDAQGQG
jgi:hypothetical protein